MANAEGPHLETHARPRPGWSQHQVKKVREKLGFDKSSVFGAYKEKFKNRAKKEKKLTC
jgi:hypothetical protein